MTGKQALKWVVIGFNALMAVWLAYGVGVATESDGYELLGVGAGLAMILGLWVSGSVILGVLWMVSGREKPGR